MMDAVILTALPVEFNAVYGHLKNCTSETFKGTIYEIGTFTCNRLRKECAVAEIGQYDTTSAIETERAITHFTPQIALFVGVAGGLKPKDLSIGDVVAASKAYGYESGKAAAEFKPRPEVFQSSYRLVQLARVVARSGKWSTRIMLHSEDLEEPKALIGPIASGLKVVTSTRAAVYEFLRANYNDALAVEMEGLGFLSAAHANPQVNALVIRGISDLIDDKDTADAGGSQDLAAHRAAAFAFEMLSKYWHTVESTPMPEARKELMNNSNDIGLEILRAIHELYQDSFGPALPICDRLRPKLDANVLGAHLDLLSKSGHVEVARGTYIAGLSLPNGTYNVRLTSRGLLRLLSDWF